MPRNASSNLKKKKKGYEELDIFQHWNSLSCIV